MVPKDETHVSEVQARQELDSIFRAAGFRILNDEPVRVATIEITLDGYDPERLVGYEYIDPLEASLSLDANQRRVLTKNAKILVLSACDIEELRARASAFLKALPVS